MNIYTGPVAPTYATSVRFEVKSSVSQLTKNIGTYMSAWQNAEDITTVRMDLSPEEVHEGAACNFLFVWVGDPVVLEVTYPGAEGEPDQTASIPVSSAFFVDTDILSWKITNSGMKQVHVEVTSATATPT